MAQATTPWSEDHCTCGRAGCAGSIQPEVGPLIGTTLRGQGCVPPVGEAAAAKYWQLGLEDVSAGCFQEVLPTGLH